MFQKKNVVKKVLIIAGPTASGKSLLALSIAEKIKGSIINADSMQIYKGLPILTAQPQESFHKRAPHYLYGVLAPFETNTAKNWCDLVYDKIIYSYNSGYIPIVVGGTGMYLETLISGLSFIPTVAPQVKEETEKILQQQGIEYLYEKLKNSDPDLANRISPLDSQRIVRGWNVWVSSGKKLSEWQLQPRRNFSDLLFLKVLVSPSRNLLRELCKQRFINMIKNDVVQEVKNNRYFETSWPIYKALGYREIREYLSGNITLDKATLDTILATQKYAKRQLTWFRNRFTADLILESIDQIDLLKKKIKECGF